MLEQINKNKTLGNVGKVSTFVATFTTGATSLMASGVGTVAHADEVSQPQNVNVQNNKEITQTKNENKVHIVQKGDTLYGIAQKTGISLQKLFDYNHLNANSILQVGQKIYLTGEKAENESEQNNKNEDMIKVKQTVTKETIDENGKRTVTKNVKYVLVPRSEANKTYTNTQYRKVQSNQADTTNTAATQQGQSGNQNNSQGANVGYADSNTAQANTTQASSSKAQAIVNRAKQLANMNIPYVWGGTSLSGMDCSGLVKIVLGEQGIDIGRVTTQQEQHVVKKSVSQAQPGDLLFWGPQGSTYHVAIYIGNNQYVEAPQPGQTVHVNTINSYYMPSFAGSIPGVNA